MRHPWLRVMAAALVCMLAVPLLGLGAVPNDTALEVYLIDPCGGCQGAAGPGCGECKLEDEAFLRYRALLKDIGQPQRRIRLINLRRNPERYDGLEARLRELGHEDFQLPVLLVGEGAFPAEGRADELVKDYLTTGKLPEGIDMAAEEAEPAASQSENTQRSMIYLYSKYCQDCRLISPWLEEHLPEGIELMSYDIGSQEGLQLELAVEAYFGITQDDFMVPALISGQTLMLGSEHIQEGFAAALEQADQTPLSALLAPAD